MPANATEGAHTWVPHVLRKDIAFNTPGVGGGISMGAVPAGAIITSVDVHVTAIFNAATTNVLVVGTAGTADAYLAAADVNEGAVGFTRYSGKAAVVATPTEVFVRFTESGAAATTGAAVVMVNYVLDPARYA